MSINSGKTELKGRVLEIIRMSTEDGPGIRTTVFFKGCTLRCAWCHNPESMAAGPQVQWIQAHCIGCGICIKACPVNALSQGDREIFINRSLCTGCGTCADTCPSTAIELLGKEWTVDALAAELVKDRAYFEQSGGGVTLSGGEAAMQKNFCLALLKTLRAGGIQTALDTCGHVSRDTLASLLPYTDLILYDIKEINPKLHKDFTGASNATILKNAVFIAEFMKNHIYPGSFWVRTPVIPDATATGENIRGIGEFIKERLGGSVERWELCAFNNLCRDKYSRLGHAWTYGNHKLLTGEVMDYLAGIARASGVDPSIVVWTGPTELSGDGHPEATNVKEQNTIRDC